MQSLYVISTWASRHKWPARALLAGALLLLHAVGLFTGGLISLQGHTLPASVLQLLCLAAIVAAAAYPSATARGKKETYGRRKSMDAVLIICTFGMLVFTGNNAGSTSEYPVARSWGTAGYASHANNSQPAQPHAGQSAGARLQSATGSIRTGIRHFRTYYKEMSKGGKIGLTALTVVVAALLIVLLIGLSCSIACSGAEALGVAVFVLGAAAIIFFSIRTIRYIFKGKRKKGSVF